MILLLISADNLLGLAAIIASFSGVVLTIASVRSGRKDATKRAEIECHEKLLQCQREAEKLSEELHQLKMREYGGYGYEEGGVQ